MKKNTLPPLLKGDWIWGDCQRKQHSQSLLFRKNFILKSVVPFAEFCISASYAYHLFVNGEQVGFGPAAATSGNVYCDFYDISVHLEPGTNTIGIIALDLGVPSYSHLMKEPGVWCQLNINNTPLVWTDSEWSVCDASVTSLSCARRNTGIEFTEKHMLEYYPSGWSKPDFQDQDWSKAKSIRPVADLKTRLIAYPCDPCSIILTDDMELLGQGKFTEDRQHANVSFHTLAETNGEYGTYAAQTFIHSKETKSFWGRISSDDPYVIMLNDKIIASMGVELGKLYPEVHHHAFPLEFSTIESVPLFPFRVELQEGWNRLVVLQKTSASSMGFVLVFPELQKGYHKFLREPDENSQFGWKIAGPLKMPIEAAAPSIHVDKLDFMPFSSAPENVVDASTWLDSCKFELYNPSKEQGSTASDGIAEGEYMIFELPSLTYGYPLMEFEGHRGDIIDITCGNEIGRSKVLPVCPILGRNTDTLILRDGENTVFRLYPRGTRYIMISVRKALDTVKPISIRYAMLVREGLDESEFECSDPIFNDIWSKSLSALKQTSNLSFIDTPCGKRSQSILESMIQSLASFYLLGDFHLSEKALLEFASAQIETGNMPDIPTSDLCVYQPEFALVWPIWLNYHWNFTGHSAFRDKMIPHLDMLVEYFKYVSDHNDGLLVSAREEQSHSYLTVPGKIAKTAYLTAVNAVFCRSMLSAAIIYEDAEATQKANGVRQLAARAAEKIRELAFQKDKKLFADSYSDAGPSDACSAQTNLLALLSGIAPMDCLETIMDTFVSDSKIKDSDPASLFNIFMLETLFAFDYGERAFKMMKNTYAGKPKKKFSPETAMTGIKDESDSKHVGKIIPGIFLMRELLGVRPAVSGLSQIYFNPAINIVSYAKGHLATPYGKIFVEWTYIKGDLNVKIEANYPLDVAPILPGDLFERCKFQLGESVSLLDTRGIV